MLGLLATPEPDPAVRRRDRPGDRPRSDRGRPVRGGLRSRRRRSGCRGGSRPSWPGPGCAARCRSCWRRSRWRRASRRRIGSSTWCSCWWCCSRCCRARRCRGWPGGSACWTSDAAHEVDIDVAPLERLGADMLQLQVPSKSRLAGVEIGELRLPAGVSVSLVIRGRAGVRSGPADRTAGRRRHPRGRAEPAARTDRCAGSVRSAGPAASPAGSASAAASSHSGQLGAWPDGIGGLGLADREAGLAARHRDGSAGARVQGGELGADDQVDRVVVPAVLHDRCPLGQLHGHQPHLGRLAGRAADGERGDLVVVRLVRRPCRSGSRASSAGLRSQRRCRTWRPRCRR